MIKSTPEIVNQDNPYLKVLLKKIEQEAGFKEGMVGKEKMLIQFLGLSRNNVRKIWRYDIDISRIRELDLLVEKANIENVTAWNDYVKQFPDVHFFDGNQVWDAEQELVIGSCVTYGLFPFRYIIVEYQGDCLFVVKKYVGKGPDLSGQKIDARGFIIKPTSTKTLTNFEIEILDDIKIIGELGDILTIIRV